MHAVFIGVVQHGYLCVCMHACICQCMYLCAALISIYKRTVWVCIMQHSVNSVCVRVLYLSTLIPYIYAHVRVSIHVQFTTSGHRAADLCSMYLCIYVCTHKFKHVDTHVCACIRVYMSSSVCAFVSRTSTCNILCACACVCAYIHSVYVYIHIVYNFILWWINYRVTQRKKVHHAESFTIDE